MTIISAFSGTGGGGQVSAINKNGKMNRIFRPWATNIKKFDLPVHFIVFNGSGSHVALIVQTNPVTSYNSLSIQNPGRHVYEISDRYEKFVPVNSAYGTRGGYPQDVAL